MSWNASDYARNSSAQTSWARDLLGSLRLEGSEHLLDLGCGDGRITAELAAMCHRGTVLGVDLSVNMIELARRMWGDRPGLEFRVMDAACLDLERRFDIVFSNAALHWVSDHPAVLRGVRSCLRDGGRILFQMGGKGNAADIAAMVDEVRATPPYRDAFVGFVSPYHFHGAEEYRAWLETCGFLPLRVSLLPRDMRHESVDGLKGWLRTTWFPYTDRLPESERERFWDITLDRYLARHPPDEQGGTHVAMVRLEVEAVVS